MELAFWHEKKAERNRVRSEEKRRMAWIEAELAGLSTLDENDDRWLDLLFTSSESSDEIVKEE
jgi:hypothetical protein